MTKGGIDFFRFNVFNDFKYFLFKIKFLILILKNASCTYNNAQALHFSILGVGAAPSIKLIIKTKI